MRSILQTVDKIKKEKKVRIGIRFIVIVPGFCLFVTIEPKYI